MRRGVVVAPQPMAAEAGAAILDQGGNAFDAAVATAFMQMATDPFMCGIGGYGIANLYCAASGENSVVDFIGTVGSRARPDMWADRIDRHHTGVELVEGLPNEIGYASATTPGTVAGMAEIHRRWGSLPWSALLRPAVEALQMGYPMPAYVKDYFDYPFGAHRPTFFEWLRTTKSMGALWLKADGSLPRPGDVWRNPDYAETLAILAEQGADAFYRGEIARRIADDMAANGGHITAKDLAGYQPIIRQPLTTSYRGHLVSSTPPPASGVILLQMLNVLEGFPLGEMDNFSPEYVCLLARVMEWSLANQKLIGDPAFVDSPVSSMLDLSTAKDARDAIIDGRPPGRKPGAPDAGTTNLTVCDASGNIAVITHSLGAGSGVVTPGLGFQYNSAIANFDPRPGRPASAEPGKREWRAHVPTIVMSDGRPFMALGSPGGSKIITAVLQTILNVVDHGMAPLEAVSAPRVYAEAGKARVEARVRKPVVDLLRAQGYHVTATPQGYDTIQGRVQLVVVSGDGSVYGASDPRRDGGIAAYATR